MLGFVHKHTCEFCMKLPVLVAWFISQVVGYSLPQCTLHHNFVLRSRSCCTRVESWVLKDQRHHYFSSKSFSFCGMWPIFRIFNFSGGIWLDDKKFEWKNGGALWLSAVKMQNVNANISQTNDSNDMESTWQQLWLTMTLTLSRFPTYGWFLLNVF